jgi:hypothetical protein
VFGVLHTPYKNADGFASAEQLRHRDAEPGQVRLGGDLLVVVVQPRLRVRPEDEDGAELGVEEPDEGDAGVKVVFFAMTSSCVSDGERISTASVGGPSTSLAPLGVRAASSGEM